MHIKHFVREECLCSKITAIVSFQNIHLSEGASSDIIRSGHQELNTLWASNEITTPGSITVNVVNAPNDSTVQCGCDNISCPFCNLMMSIALTDPSVLQ